jgi:hypothetical protein
MLDSLVRVSRRAVYGHYASILQWRASVRAGRIVRRAITPRGATFPTPLSARPNRCWPDRGEVHLPEDRLNPAGKSGRIRFPFNNFTYCLTLFSKCFSSFDHSTCALSVSGRYLALDGIYHPFRAAFPNNSTRRRGLTWGGSRPDTGFSPSMTSCSKGLGPVRTRDTLYKLQLGRRRRQISNLSCCRFTRRYWGNPCWFLFLRLLICLSSAGIPA